MGDADEPTAGERVLERLRARRAGEADERLHRLAGVWRGEGTWGLGGRDAPPVPIELITTNSVTLGGRVVDSVSTQAGEVGSQVLYGWDESEQRYYAFAVNSMTSGYDLELGRWDPEHDRFVFTCTEYVGPRREAIPFRRTLTFVPEGYDLTIDYPDHEHDRRVGEMHLRMRRVEP